jgi:hypothetical protein
MIFFERTHYKIATARKSWQVPFRVSYSSRVAKHGFGRYAKKRKSRLDPAATSPMTTKPDGRLREDKANGEPIVPPP